MFCEMVVGNMRAQANLLKQIVAQLELDENWGTYCEYYARELYDIEKALRMIRKMQFKRVYKCS